MKQTNTFRKELLPAKLVLVVLLPLILASCDKYLDKKPRQNLAIPSNMQDLQAILDNESFSNASPGDLEFVTDNFYLTNSTFNSLGTNVEYRMSYIWDKNATITSPEVWNLPYNAVYQANFVLDQLPNITIGESDQNTLDNVKGSALFYRGFTFYQLAQLFCKPYSTSAGSDPGIVLRLTSAVGTPSTRATVEQTYKQIIADLKIAASLLPVTSSFVTRPNRSAAYGALARVYLSMRNYDKALLYADSCLNTYGTLLDYNLLSSYNSSPFPYFANNPEILYLSYEGSLPRLFRNQLTLVDTVLYQSYEEDDLRKSVFYAPSTTAGSYYWRGSYHNYASPSTIFDGIATDEIYLIRAECNARKSNKDAALMDLNFLIKKRWKNTVPFPAITATDANDALNKILAERRKELAFRGLRWTDLRRFNLENPTHTLVRIINNTTYTLPPNDLRWVLLIPSQEIGRSGIGQNPR